MNLWSSAASACQHPSPTVGADLRVCPEHDHYLTLTAEEEDRLRRQLRAKFDRMMQALYKQQGASLDITILAEDEVRQFIDTHADALNGGFRQVEMSDAMRQRLERSNRVFSGMKTFHELNESFPSLLDENGDRKPFERFLNDVRKVDETYNSNYLRSEYNFVHASAAMAAKWERFLQDGDRYYLQYRTAGDDRVRPEHAALEGVTLPMDDPFWEEYYVPNSWNCRCSVVQVRKSKYPKTDHDEAMRLGELAIGKYDMFRFNSGKQQKAVPDYNPYTIRQCRQCPVASGDGKENLAAFIPQSDLCQACRIVRRQDAEKHRVSPIVNARDDRRQFKQLKADARREVKAQGYVQLRNKQLYTGRLYFGKDQIDAVSSHFFDADEVNAFRKLPQLLHELKDGRYLPVDMRRPNYKEKMKKRGVLHFTLYNVTIDGVDYELKCAVKRDKNDRKFVKEFPYSLKKKK